MGPQRDIDTATRTVTRQGRSAPQQVSGDICVVGAGISGVSAALEAARLGRQVVLVDGMPALGGQAVHSIIGTFCGLFANGTHGQQFTHGIADDILRDLGASGALHFRHGPMTTVVLYDAVALSRWVEDAIRQAGILVLVGGIVRAVIRRERRIEALDLATRYGDVRLTAAGFVDATGDAALAWQAGLPCRKPANGSIYGTQMLVVEGVDESHYPDRDELSERLSRRAGAYGLVRRDGFAFRFPGRGTALVNMTHIETPLEPIAAAAAALDGKAQADRVLTFLQTEYPAAFGGAKVRAYGFPGIRQTRWIVSRKQLTADEVRQGTRFPDAVARTAWPIELHDRATGYVWEPFAEDHVHYVPFRSLTPPDVDNLVAAGRCVDGDVAALSSIRVLGPCLATGAAAAHALDICAGGSVHDVDIAALRERLKENLEPPA